MIVIPSFALVIGKPVFLEVVVYAFTWGYAFFVLFTERFITGRGEFLDRVRRTSVLCLILPVLMLTNLSTFGRAILVCGPYLITALVSAGFLLRELRIEPQMKQQKGYYRQQIGEMLLFLIISIFLTIARAPQNLLVGLQLLYLNVIQPVIGFIGGLIGIVFGAIMYFLISGVSLFVNSRELTQRKDEFGNSLRDTVDTTAINVTVIDWILPLLYSVGAILGLAVLFFFFRWLMGEKYQQELMEGVLETREEITDTEDKHNSLRVREPKEPRAMVRFYYRKYLLRLRHKKIVIRNQDTTSEIDRKYNETLLERSGAQREASKQMKQLYRKARYQMGDEITSREAEDAKQLYHSIKSTNKNS
jgi:hypothetical protein